MTINGPEFAGDSTGQRYMDHAGVDIARNVPPPPAAVPDPKPILLIGCLGSMGRRYAAILRHLGVPWRGCDEGTTPTIARSYASAPDCRGIIIASPTHTHADYIRALSLLGLPILCEKPLSTDLDTVAELLRAPCPLDMMQQYSLLAGDPLYPGATTSYDFYHSGSDGLNWDCMQLLGLARGPVSLKAESPVWRCTLNGRRLSLDDVGQAYVDYVAWWLEHSEGDRAMIRRMHEAAAAWRGETVGEAR